MIEHNATITGWTTTEGVRGDGTPALSANAVTLAAPCLLLDPSDRLRARLEAKGIEPARTLRVYAAVLRGAGVGEPKVGDRVTVRPTRLLALEETLRVAEATLTDGDGEWQIALSATG